jgi:acyl-CoA synthetase (AMP-forming)/AMP-acid ligase II
MSDSEPLVEDLCGLYAGTAVAAYLNAFKVGEVDHFISYYTAPYTNPSAIYSRAEFLSLSLRAAGLLSRLRLSRGDTHVHFMSTNRVEDLAVRLASALLYTTPVTVNWQADTVDTVRYKVELADARVLLFDKGVSEDMLTELRTLLLPKGVLFVNIEDIYIEKPVKLEQLRGRLAPKCDEDTRMVIFTSGTTGRPKGVELTFDNYACNALTFDSFLDPHSNISPVCVLVNPLHHTNSTSLADWALRRGDATVHLLDKYTTSYWAFLTNITAATIAGARVIAPLVSRHIDFLAALSEAHALGVESDVLRATLSQVVLLMGSSPVGPTTVERLQRIAGALPTVRFGSTETTLQVCGIPLTMSETEVLAAFRRGWEQKPLVGYFIGREHPGLTEVSVVRSVAPGLPGYMEPVDSGIPGLLITRGAHVMKAYLNSDSRYSHAEIAT